MVGAGQISRDRTKIVRRLEKVAQRQSFQSTLEIFSAIRYSPMDGFDQDRILIAFKQ